jgi:hypothetical protein
LVGPVWVPHKRLEETEEKWLKTLPWSYADAVRSPGKKRVQESPQPSPPKPRNPPQPPTVEAPAPVQAIPVEAPAPKGNT